MSDIGEMLGQNATFKLMGTPKIVNDCIVIIPNTETTEFSKYLGAFHSYGEAINNGCEHVSIFSYPISGHARISFFGRNEFYHNDPFYFMLMTVKHEDNIKNAIKKNILTRVNFEIQPASTEEDYGDI